MTREKTACRGNSGLEGARPIAEIIAEISSRSDNPFFLSPVFRRGDELAFVPPRVLVRFNADISESFAEFVIRTVGLGEVLQANWGGMEGAYWVDPRTKSGFRALAVANRLAEQPEVRWAEPGLVSMVEPSSCSPISPNNPPKDEHFADSWHLHNPLDSLPGNPDGEVDVNAPGAWAQCGGSPSIPIAIFDNGVDKNHEDLNVAVGADCTLTLTTPSTCKCDNLSFCEASQFDSEAGSPQFDGENHGTMVAGVASALINNAPLGGPIASGSSGVAPNLTLISVRAFFGAWDSNDVVGALEWSLQNGIRVVNISWNSLFVKPSETEKYAEVRAAGMIVFASAGNFNEDNARWPANLDTVVAVSAVSQDGTLWVETVGIRGSNYGPQISVSAPGDGILSTDRIGLASGYSSDPSVVCTVDGNYCILSGTSYAAPIVASIAGMILSINPALSPDQVEDILCRTAQDVGDPGWDPFYGCGIVDAEAAVAMAVDSLTWIFSDGFESGELLAWSSTVGN